jgi:MFS family permease
LEPSAPDVQSVSVTSTRVPRSGPGRQLFPIAGTFVSIGVFIGTWTVVTPEIEAALGGGPGRLGLVLTLALVAAAAMNTLGGALTERRGTTVALRWTLAWWTVALATGAVAPAPWGVALGVVVAMSGSGAVDVVANVGATAALADRPGRLVRIHAAFNIGAAAGAVLTGVLLGLAGAVGWRIAWACAAAGVATMFAVSLRAELPAGHAGEKVGLGEGMRTLRRERLVPVAIAFALGATVEGGVSTWGVLQLRSQLDAGLLLGAGGAVAGYLIGAATRIAVGGTRSAAGARRVITAGTLGAAGGLIVLATVSQPAVATLGLVVAAAGISVCWPLLMSEVGRGRERPGVVVGAVSTVGYLGIVIGPGAIGLISGAFGLSVGLLVLAAAALSIPAVLTLRRSTPAD